MSKNKAEMFKDSVVSKIFLVFIVLSFGLFIYSVYCRNMVAIVLGVIITILFIIAYLMGIQVIRELWNRFHIIPAIIALLLFIPFVYSLNNFIVDQYDWSEVVLNEKLPQPSIRSLDVQINEEYMLHIQALNVGRLDFTKYVKQVKDFGYVIEPKSYSGYYQAFNDNGDKISVNSYTFNNTMYIDLIPYEELGELVWPNSDIASLIPIPKSNIGKITWETVDNFHVKVGNTTLKDFNAYVELCKEKGFTVDYSRGEDSFYAYNEDGYSLDLRYEGFNTMYIRLSNNKNY